MATINGTEFDDYLPGTPEDDNISGNGGDDTIEAGAGDDTLRGGEGDDIIDGGAGERDQVRYDRVLEGVFVNLGTGIADDGWFDTDALIDIEDLRGSMFADTLIGSEAGNQILGGASGDLIRGAGGADELFGEFGNDTLDGGAGNDRLHGGEGTDTALYAGSLGDYVLRLGEGGLSVEAKSAGGSGLNRLEEMERLVFDDGFSFGAEGAVDLTVLDGAADLPLADLVSLVELYVAHFDRAPDALGLSYWATRMGDGMTLEQVAASFFEQPEAQALYPDPDDSAALVDAAYANLLDRAPDAEGRAYWIDALDSGDVSRPEFMLALINGAKAETGSEADARTIQHKAEIGLRYGAEEGLTNLDNAEAAMDAYDAADPSGSLADALDLVAAFSDAALAPESTEVVVQITGLVFGTEPMPDAI